MDTLAGDISSIVFRRAVSIDSGKISLDRQMLNFLSKLDGKKNVGMISQTVDMDMSTIRSVIPKLIKLKLIEVVKENIPTLDENFLNFLKDQLSLSTGPIALVMVEDAIRDIGHDTSAIPISRAAELIELVSRQILDTEKRTSFIQTMLGKIK